MSLVIDKANPMLFYSFLVDGLSMTEHLIWITLFWQRDQRTAFLGLENPYLLHQLMVECNQESIC